MPTTKSTDLRPPFRKLSKLVAWLLSEHNGWDCRGGRDDANYEHHAWLFCFNVKLYHLDLSFDHLLQRYQKAYTSNSYVFDPVWIRGCQRKWRTEIMDMPDCDDPINPDNYDRPKELLDSQGRLYEQAVELTRADFVDQTNQPGDVRYVFYGRSGGWLTLTHFRGIALDCNLRADLEFATKVNYVDGDPDFVTSDWIRQLSVRLLSARSFANPASACAEVEYQAAWSFFGNICDDVVSPVAEQEQRIRTEAIRLEAWAQFQNCHQRLLLPSSKFRKVRTPCVSSYGRRLLTPSQPQVPRVPHETR
jgi:hypothetical protein